MRFAVFLFLLLATAVLAQTSPTSSPTAGIAAKPHGCDHAWYPPSAVRAHAEGTATVAFTVTSTGTVANASIKTSSGNADLDDAALKCVQEWSYPPPTENGAPKELQKEVAIKWTLNDFMPPPRPIVGSVQTCIRNAHPSDEALSRTSRETLVEIRFAGSGHPYAELWRSSGNPDLDGLIVDCLQQLPPELFPNGTRFLIPFSWKADPTDSSNLPPAASSNLQVRQKEYPSTANQ